MTSLRQYIARQRRPRRKPRAARPPMREGTGAVSVVRSPRLDTASVALLGDVALEDRAARMNAFWDKLVDLQHRDVLVVALCVGDER